MLKKQNQKNKEEEEAEEIEVRLLPVEFAVLVSPAANREFQTQFNDFSS